MRRVLSVVQSGVAKTPELQCTRIKLSVQPVTLETYRKSIDSFFLIKGLSCTKSEGAGIKKSVQRKIVWKLYEENQ